LSNKNKSAIILKIKKKLELNKALVHINATPSTTMGLTVGRLRAAMARDGSGLLAALVHRLIVR